MITYVIFNKGTSAERTTAGLVERLKEARVETELIDADSPRGIQLAQTYQIFGRPAVLLIKDDGAPVQIWEGEDRLPPIADVISLAHQ